MNCRIVKLGDIVDVLKTTVNPQKNRHVIYNLYSLPGFDNNKTVEILSGKEISSNKIVLNEKCILFNKLNLKFKRVWRYFNCENNSICSTEFIPLILKDKEVNFDYLYYYLINDEFYNQVMENASGTSNSHQRIHKDDLLEKCIELPDIKTQNRIAKILNDLDKKIDNNKMIDIVLKKVCKTMYLNYTKYDYLNVSLSELMEHQGGSQPPASKFEYIKSNDNIRFVQIRDFDSNSHKCYIPISTKNKLCKKDDILIARYGASLGRICYGLEGAYNVALAKVIPKKEEYKELLRVILESDEFYNYINLVGQRSAQSGFNSSDIEGYNVRIPNEENLIKYINIANNIIKNRTNIIDENKKLEELKENLLCRIMNKDILI